MSEIVLKSTHEGTLRLGDIEIECHVLEDKSRILSSRGMLNALNLKSGQRNQSRVLTPFLEKIRFISLSDKELANRISTPIKFVRKGKGGKPAYGYPAELLPEICNAVLKLQNKYLLPIEYLKAADRSRVFLNTFAKIGIIALIDEATGFQYNRKHDALRILLEQYIEEELQKWIKRFPDEFFNALDKLYKNDKTNSHSRPSYYGHFINTYIYKPLENGYVKSELNKMNILPDGKRKARFHQWLTEFGVHQLTLQIGRVMGIIEISPNIIKFKETIARQKSLAIQPELFDEE